MRLNGLKLAAAAFGLGIALAAGPAAADTNWTSPTTLFEDDDIDFVLNDTNGVIDEGDILFSIIEIVRMGGALLELSGEELTGVVAIEVIDVVDLDNDGQVDDLIFGPVGGLGGPGLAAFGLGPAGSTIAMWLDETPNLDIVLPGISCNTLAECVAQATDGTFFQADGFAGDPDEYWYSLNAFGTSYAAVLSGNPTAPFAAFDFGQTTLATGPDHVATAEAVPCSPLAISFGLCTGNQLVWIQGQGSVLGGAGLPAGLVADGAFGTSDFDAIKALQVPEPGSLALLALGLLSLGAVARRSRRVRK